MTALESGPALDRAVAFAAAANRGGVQAWMLWAGWEQHVGCHQCADEGPDAPCWGIEGCHGFENDCSCTECVELEALELARARRRDTSAPALRDELAGVGEQIDQPMDGRVG